MTPQEAKAISTLVWEQNKLYPIKRYRSSPLPNCILEQDNLEDLPGLWYISLYETALKAATPLDERTHLIYAWRHLSATLTIVEKKPSNYLPHEMPSDDKIKRYDKIKTEDKYLTRSTQFTHEVQSKEFEERDETLIIITDNPPTEVTVETFLATYNSYPEDSEVEWHGVVVPIESIVKRFGLFYNRRKRNK